MAITSSSGSTRRSSTGPSVALANGVNSSTIDVGHAHDHGHQDGGHRRRGRSTRRTTPTTTASAEHRRLPRPRGDAALRARVGHEGRSPSQVASTTTPSRRARSSTRRQQRIDGYLIHDWDRRSHGNVTMQWVLDNSLNNGAIDAMKMEGENAFYNNLLAFGIGAPTGIDLAGEVNNPLRPAGVVEAAQLRGGHLRTGPRDHAGGDARRGERRGQWRRLGATARRRRHRQPQHRHDHAVRAGDPPRDLGHRRAYPRAHDGGRGERPGWRGQAGQDPRLQHGDRRQDRDGPGGAAQRQGLRPQRGGVIRRLHARDEPAVHHDGHPQQPAGERGQPLRLDPRGADLEADGRVDDRLPGASNREAGDRRRRARIRGGRCCSTRRSSACWSDSALASTSPRTARRAIAPRKGPRPSAACSSASWRWSAWLAVDRSRDGIRPDLRAARRCDRGRPRRRRQHQRRHAGSGSPSGRSSGSRVSPVCSSGSG